MVALQSQRLPHEDLLLLGLETRPLLFQQVVGCIDSQTAFRCCASPNPKLSPRLCLGSLGISLSCVDGFGKNLIISSSSFLCLFFVYTEMASKKKMLYLPGSFIFWKMLVKVKESLKYEGIDCSIGWSMEITQTPNA